MSDYLLAICERASSLFWGAARFYLLSSRLYAHARNRARLWLVISGVRMEHEVFLSVMAQKDYCRFSSPTIRVYDIQAPSYPHGRVRLVLLLCNLLCFSGLSLCF